MDVWESDVAPQLLTDRTLAGDAAPVASEHWREREATPGACGGGLRGPGQGMNVIRRVPRGTNAQGEWALLSGGPVRFEAEDRPDGVC